MKRREVGGALIGAAAYSVLRSETAAAQSCTAPCYAQTPAEASAGLTPTNYEYSPSPVYDMARYGISPNGADNTAIVQAVFNMVKTSGGTMSFPFGDWAFYLDISGSGHQPVYIEGNGSTFRPHSSSPPNSAVVYAYNSQFAGSNVSFRNCGFTARTYGSSSPGDVQYCVELHGTSAQFWSCSFSYGTAAAFYAFFGQYTEFWSCTFAAATASGTSAGCILDSAGLAASTNEVLFARCKFFSNSNGLILKGAQLTRVRDCTIQDTRTGGTAGILLDSDSTGSDCGGTVIEGCWFELNATAHIVGDGHQSTVIRGNTFWPTQASGPQTSVVQFGTSASPKACYDLKIIDNNWLGGGTVTITIFHPPANADTATLTWHGNGSGAGGPMLPTAYSLTHAGPTYIDGPNNVSSLSK
jgi:hypothetical protein